MTLSILAWVVVAVSVGGVIIRPFHWPEFVWAIAGAVIVSGFASAVDTRPAITCAAHVYNVSGPSVTFAAFRPGVRSTPPKNPLPSVIDVFVSPVSRFRNNTAPVSIGVPSRRFAMPFR